MSYHKADPPVADARLQIMAILYPALQIAMVTHGGGGKHTWDVTYAEYYIFNKVGENSYEVKNTTDSTESSLPLSARSFSSRLLALLRYRFVSSFAASRRPHRNILDSLMTSSSFYLWAIPCSPYYGPASNAHLHLPCGTRYTPDNSPNRQSVGLHWLSPTH